jgi:hypothetical protein
MKLSIQKHITLIPGHPKLPDWLFISNDTIMHQTISLDENHMKELLLFLVRNSLEFSLADIKVSVVDFSDITLEYLIL